MFCFFKVFNYAPSATLLYRASRRNLTDNLRDFLVMLTLSIPSQYSTFPYMSANDGVFQVPEITFLGDLLKGRVSAWSNLPLNQGSCDELDCQEMEPEEVCKALAKHQVQSTYFLRLILSNSLKTLTSR